MAGKKKRTRLFESHLRDLRSVCPEAGDVFVCPICFQVFSAHDLDDTVTIGHVWPKCIRKCTQGTGQKALLCSNCNNKAGTYCEAALQRFEELKQCHEANQFYRPHIQALPAPGVGPPAQLRVPIELRKNETRATLTFPVDRKTGHPAYAPEELKKFEQYLTPQANAEGKAVVFVREGYPVQEEWPRVQAALLISSYLLAFYLLGYRYIFQDCLTPVRRYISDLLTTGEADDRLEVRESQNTAVWGCTECSRVAPEVLFVIVPNTEAIPCHLRTNILDYHVRMPVPADSCLTSVPPEVRAELEAVGAEIVVDVTDDGVNELLGQPDYYIKGEILTLRSKQ
jgi:hypothetical protein